MSRRLRPSSRFLVLAYTLWAGVAAGSPAASQQSPQATGSEQPAEGFFDVVDVEIVNVDVWVTDRRGRPVHGLSQEDFVVLRDGAPVAITNFYAVRDPRLDPEEAVDVASDGASVSAAGDEPPERSLGAPATGVAPEHRLWLILYLDNYNLDPIERNRILPSLRRFLSRNLRPGDRTMVVSYDRFLEVRQPFTDNNDLLFEALAELVDESGFAVVRRRDQIATLKLIDKSRDSGQALSYARQYAEEQMDGVERTARALEELIDSLGGLPGRKAMVYVSSGVPMVAGEEMFHAVAEKFDASSEAFSQIPRHDTSRSFERLDRRANEQRVAFYTLDAGGLRVMEFGAAEYGGFVDPRLRKTLDSVVPENLQSPLRLMAIETGGQAILNRNDVLPALEEAARDFRSFYSLGISSTSSDAGRYHRIEVRLRESRNGLRLRHRAGYRGKDIETRTREQLRSALLYAHHDNPLGVEVTWGQPREHGDEGNYLLPIQLQVPLRDTVLLPSGNGRHEARLKLFIAAAGNDGGISSIDTAPLGVRLASEHVEAAKRESLVHTHRLLLSPGRKKVGIAILDVFGREASVVTSFVQVGPAEDSG